MLPMLMKTKPITTRYLEQDKYIYSSYFMPLHCFSIFCLLYLCFHTEDLQKNLVKVNSFSIILQKSYIYDLHCLQMSKIDTGL